MKDCCLTTHTRTRVCIYIFSIMSVNRLKQNDRKGVLKAWLINICKYIIFMRMHVLCIYVYYNLLNLSKNGWKNLQWGIYINFLIPLYIYIYIYIYIYNFVVIIIFQVWQKYHKQKFGLHMGSPLSGILACLFLEFLTFQIHPTRWHSFPLTYWQHSNPLSK